MIKFIASVLFVAMFSTVFAQAPVYSRVKVFLGEHSIQDLAKLGIEVDHGNYRKGVWIENDFSAKEISDIKAAGFNIEVQIEDVQAYYQKPHKKYKVNYRGDGCPSGQKSNWKTPEHYTAGSMGGYLTLSELYEVLDKMVELYPNLISVKSPIDTFKTQEGRPIYSVKISNHPNEEEGEPKMLYTALHHAREPNSLAQLVFYMWYLLENYETDTEIQNLVDNVELFFIPCINPDGYVYNETTNPNGGGLWRKNRWISPVGDQDGVDLNRNYSYKWGFDNVGSSVNLNSSTFRGPSAASEPEIKAVNFLCNQFDFKIALNYHTFGNLLIHPWGYSDMNTVDHGSFQAIGRSMIKGNDFLLGTGTATVGYTVNGDSDDWMYGEKNIFSMTPEVGPSFWPDSSEIIDLNKTTLYQNITAAKLLLNFVEGNIVEKELNLTTGSLHVNLNHAGLKEGETTVSLISLNSKLQFPNDSYILNMKHLDTETKSFDYTISASNGENLQVLLKIENDLFLTTDTVQFVYWANNKIEFSETGETVDNWEGDWQSTTEAFYSAETSITDSPSADYPSNATSTIMSPEIDLTEAQYPELVFYAKWDVERGYDYVQVLATMDNGETTQPLCGLWTNNGTADQDEDQPVYDGKQSKWVKEIIDLNDFVGKKIKIVFKIVSDPFVQGDGFYFDDFKVVTHGLPDKTSDLETSLALKLFPMPAHDKVNIELSQKTIQPINIFVFNNLGVKVMTTKIDSGSYGGALDVTNLVSGIYFVQVQMNDKNIFGKFIKE